MRCIYCLDLFIKRFTKLASDNDMDKKITSMPIYEMYAANESGDDIGQKCPQNMTPSCKLDINTY